MIFYSKIKNKIFLFEFEEIVVILILFLMIFLFLFTLGMHLGKSIYTNQNNKFHSHSNVQTVVDQVPSLPELTEMGRHVSESLESLVVQELFDELKSLQIRLDIPQQLSIPKNVKK